MLENQFESKKSEFTKTLTGLLVSGLTVPTGPNAPRLTAFELSVEVEIKKLDMFFITSVSNTGCKSILCLAAERNLFKNCSSLNLMPLSFRSKWIVQLLKSQ